MKHWLLLLLVAGAALAKPMPGQDARAAEPRPVRSRLVLTLANPKDFQLAGQARWLDKTLNLSATEAGSATWRVPDSLAGKTLEVRFTCSLRGGEAEAYLLYPTGVRSGQTTLRVGTGVSVRLAGTLPAKGPVLLRFDLQPATALSLGKIEVYQVDR